VRKTVPPSKDDSPADASAKAAGAHDGVKAPSAAAPASASPLRKPVAARHRHQLRDPVKHDFDIRDMLGRYGKLL